MENKKVIVSLITGMVFLVMNTATNADDNSTYAELTIPTTFFSANVSATSGVVSSDETGKGYKILFGKNISKYISLEGFYSDFGKVFLQGKTGDSFTLYDQNYQFGPEAVLTTRLSGIGVNASMNYEITDVFSIHGRIGILNWKKSMVYSAVGSSVDEDTGDVTAITVSPSLEKNGSDTFYGAGFKYNITEKYAFTANYILYRVDKVNLVSRSLGIQSKF